MKHIKMITTLVLVACFMLGLIACGDKEGAKEAEYKLGLGVELNTASSKDNNAQVDATVAAVVLDSDGKIVMCRIDCAQSKMDVTGGAVDTAKTFQSKMELGDAYGMAGKVDNNGDGVMLEWDAQTKAFEEYVAGKTGAEVEAMETQEVNGHQISVDETLLKAGCTIQITDYIKAVVKACNDSSAVTFKASGDFKLGVGANTVASESTAATATEEGSVKMYTDFGAAVVADGKIIAALNDAVQPQIAITAEGKIASSTFKGTKRELGSAYGMEGKVDNNGDGVMLEWDAQSAAFSAYVVGKTAAELRGLETQEVNGHKISTDETLLKAGCTIQIGGMAEAIARAVDYAR